MPHLGHGPARWPDYLRSLMGLLGRIFRLALWAYFMCLAMMSVVSEYQNTWPEATRNQSIATWKASVLPVPGLPFTETVFHSPSGRDLALSSLRALTESQNDIKRRQRRTLQNIVSVMAYYPDSFNIEHEVARNGLHNATRDPWWANFAPRKSRLLNGASNLSCNARDRLLNADQAFVHAGYPDPLSWYWHDLTNGLLFRNTTTRHYHSEKSTTSTCIPKVPPPVQFYSPRTLDYLRPTYWVRDTIIDAQNLLCHALNETQSDIIALAARLLKYEEYVNETASPRFKHGQAHKIFLGNGEHAWVSYDRGGIIGLGAYYREWDEVDFTFGRIRIRDRPHSLLRNMPGSIWEYLVPFSKPRSKVAQLSKKRRQAETYLIKALDRLEQNHANITRQFQDTRWFEGFRAARKSIVSLVGFIVVQKKQWRCEFTSRDNRWLQGSRPYHLAWFSDDIEARQLITTLRQWVAIEFGAADTAAP